MNPLREMLAVGLVLGVLLAVGTLGLVASIAQALA